MQSSSFSLSMVWLTLGCPKRPQFEQFRMMKPKGRRILILPHHPDLQCHRFLLFSLQLNRNLYLFSFRILGYLYQHISDQTHSDLPLKRKLNSFELQNSKRFQLKHESNLDTNIHKLIFTSFVLWINIWNDSGKICCGFWGRCQFLDFVAYWKEIRIDFQREQRIHLTLALRIQIFLN